MSEASDIPSAATQETLDVKLLGILSAATVERSAMERKCQKLC